MEICGNVYRTVSICNISESRFHVKFTLYTLHRYSYMSLKIVTVIYGYVLHHHHTPCLI